MTELPRERLVFPLDYPDLTAARRGAESVCRSAGVLKVGLELFVREGPPAVRLGAELGCSVFLDLKLHDIPATVDRAVGSASALGARYLTVHAGGGPRMMEAAVRRAEREGSLVILAVTVLTSLDDADLKATGVGASTREHAQQLAKLAYDAGARGFVCSAHEVRALRAALGPKIILATPGIRPAAGSSHDQKRTGTPSEAVRDGADLLVVGRPIRDAPDPERAARHILNEIAQAAGTNGAG